MGQDQTIVLTACTITTNLKTTQGKRKKLYFIDFLVYILTSFPLLFSAVMDNSFSPNFEKFSLELKNPQTLANQNLKYSFEKTFSDYIFTSFFFAFHKKLSLYIYICIYRLS